MNYKGMQQFYYWSILKKIERNEKCREDFATHVERRSIPGTSDLEKAAQTDLMIIDLAIADNHTMEQLGYPIYGKKYRQTLEAYLTENRFTIDENSRMLKDCRNRYHQPGASKMTKAAALYQALTKSFAYERKMRPLRLKTIMDLVKLAEETEATTNSAPPN